jgi:predicted lactoylglutathione lyase
MEQRISLITLAVQDMDRAAAFYAALGWTRTETPDGLVVFDLLGQSLGLYARDALAADIGIPVSELGHGAMTLAHNCRSKQDVDQILQAAKDAGARMLKPAAEVFWGGYVGSFADLDGHIWEIAFNPLSELSPKGAFRWNGYQSK